MASRDRHATGSPFMDTAQLADHLHVSRATLHQWRWRREGPPAIKVGRRLLYRREDVDRWIAVQEAAGITAVPAASASARKPPPSAA